MPSVSVLIPSHRMEFLGGAMGSVFQQTFTDYELLIDYQRAPMGTRLNRLGLMARGEWLVVLADDDELLPDFLKTTLSFISSVPDAGIIYTDAIILSLGTTNGTIARMKPWTFDNFREGPPCWLTSLVRRDIWLLVGGHDGALAYHDYDFWYRCYLNGASAVHVPEPLWRYREHPGQWTKAVDRRDARERFLERHPELR